MWARLSILKLISHFYAVVPYGKEEAGQGGDRFYYLHNHFWWPDRDGPKMSWG